MEIFVSTSDGKFPCLRYMGVLHYCSPDELATKLGITDWGIELDPGQKERDLKDARIARLARHNNSLDKPWGY